METNTYKKLSEEELEVTTQEVAPAPTKIVYERSFIENQIEQITKDKADYIAKRDAELAECEAILSSMNELGIKSKVLSEGVVLEKIIN